ncbi:transposase [Kitasatospora sp. NPDC057692]|uniref:transposase n=1 Tax=Kitasatospora sp. NPDC057692 TaxID=3346215 RepID=UPI003675DA33
MTGGQAGGPAHPAHRTRCAVRCAARAAAASAGRFERRPVVYVSYTVEGTWRPLKRHGWSRQQPTRRAIERDDHAVEVWKKETWPRVGAPRRSAAPGSSSRTRPGSRLIYAIRGYHGRKDEPKGFGRRDFRDLIVRARIQLGGPIVLVRDNVRLHLTAGVREFIDANAEWLTVFQLPAYAPDLNPAEGVWSLVKRDIGNLAAADLGQITRAVKRRLKKLQPPS